MTKNSCLTGLMLGLLIFLSACSHQGTALNRFFINDKEYEADFDHSYQQIVYSLADDENRIVICLPEGALGHTWIPAPVTAGISLIKEERIQRGYKKDTDGESMYMKRYTYEIHRDPSFTLQFKKIIADDMDSEDIRENVEQIAELEIVFSNDTDDKR